MAANDLADERLRQFFPNKVAARTLVLGEMLAGRSTSCFLIELCTGLHDDRCGDHLGATTTGNANNGALCHSWQRVHYGFDLTRRNVKAASDDEFLLAVNDGDKSVFVLHDQVSSAQPATVKDGGSRFFWSVPVALEHLRASNKQLADLTLLNLTCWVLRINHANVG